jgi:hypothetical protein
LKFHLVSSSGQTQLVLAMIRLKARSWKCFQKRRRFWHQLSKQAVHEQDPGKLKVITDEINRILELKSGRPSSRTRGTSVPSRP